MENKNQPQFCFLQSFVGCGDSTHRSAVGGTERKPEQNELSSTNETIKFSVTLARQRVVGVADPYRVGAYNAIIPTTHGHGTNISCIFSNSPQSIVGCGDSTHRSAVGGTERKPEQNELSSTNETIKFSVTLARQRVVGVADPYRVGAYNAIIPTTHGHGTNISCIFSNSPQSIVGCGDSTHRSAVGGTERKLQTKQIKQHEYSKRTLCPQIRTSNRRLIISIKHFFVQTAKILFKK